MRRCSEDCGATPRGRANAALTVSAAQCGENTSEAFPWRADGGAGAPRGHGVTGVGVQRRSAFGLADAASRLRHSTAAAGEILSSSDGRWAIVSTSVTALVAGSIAWLASGLMPDSNRYGGAHDRALMPYQLFLKLAGRSDFTRVSF